MSGEAVDARRFADALLATRADVLLLQETANRASRWYTDRGLAHAPRQVALLDEILRREGYVLLRTPLERPTTTRRSWRRAGGRRRELALDGPRDYQQTLLEADGELRSALSSRWPSGRRRTRRCSACSSATCTTATTTRATRPRVCGRRGERLLRAWRARPPTCSTPPAASARCSPPTSTSSGAASTRAPSGTFSAGIAAAEAAAAAAAERRRRRGGGEQPPQLGAAPTACGPTVCSNAPALSASPPDGVSRLLCATKRRAALHTGRAPTSITPTSTGGARHVVVVVVGGGGGGAGTCGRRRCRIWPPSPSNDTSPSGPCQPCVGVERCTHCPSTCPTTFKRSSTCACACETASRKVGREAAPDAHAV